MARKLSHRRGRVLKTIVRIMEMKIQEFIEESRLTQFLWFVAFFAFLNVPYWILSQIYFMNRAIFNLELVLPLLLAPLSLKLSRLVLILLWLTDLIVGMSATFYFNSPSEFIRAVQFLPVVSVQKYVTPERLFEAVTFGLVVYSLRWVRFSKGMSSVAAMVCVGVLFAADQLNGSSMLSTRAARVADVNVAGSPSAMLLVRNVLQRDTRPLAPLLTGNAASALVDPVQWAQTHRDGGALLVLVESLGVNRQPEVRAWLRAKLLKGDVSRRFDVREAQIQFNGSTTDGEMRELCAMAGSYRSITPAVGAKCIPQQLANLGWNTTAMHGFSGAMFRRESWWSEIGFKELVFAPKFLADGARRCGGAFSGACDSDVIASALRRAREPRQFVFALTLNSHLPLGDVQIPDDLADLCRRIALPNADCRLNAVLANAMTAINDGIVAIPGPLPLVVLVGDHAPPFGQLYQRQNYSQVAVPGFALVPR